MYGHNKYYMNKLMAFFSSIDNNVISSCRKQNFERKFLINCQILYIIITIGINYNNESKT